MPALLVPLGLIVLHAVSVPLLMQGRRAIQLGNWFRHRNFMLINGGTFALVMAMTALQLFLMYLKGFSFAGVLDIALWAALALHLIGLGVLIVMVPWTLYRVARHLLLPHKLMARWTIKVWFYVAGSGVLFSGLVILTSLIG